MIVTCPACHTRYLADDEEVGGENGRPVRCASCGNLWRYSADLAAIQSAIEGAIAEGSAEAGPAGYAGSAGAATAALPALRAEPGSEVQPGHTAIRVRPPTVHAAGPPPAAIEPSLAVRRRHAIRLGRLAALSLATVLVLVAVLARDPIVALYPPAGTVYRALGLLPSPVRLGLTLNLSRGSEWLIVAGDITNRTGATQPVPRLRVALRDGDGRELDSRIIDPPVAQLPAGVVVRYRTTFDQPSSDIVEVEVAFAPE